MIVVALVSALIGFQAPPGVDDLQPAFGNTLVSTYPDGRTARLWLHADGRFEGQGRRGQANAGVWRVRDGKVCLSLRRPIPMPGSYCTPIVPGGVGTHWSAKAVTGETIRVQLVAGR